MRASFTKTLRMKISHNTTNPLNGTVIEIHPVEKWIEDRDYSNEIYCSSNNYNIVWLQSGTGIFNNGVVTSPIHQGFIFCLTDVQHKIVVDANATGFVISFSKILLATGELEFDLSCQANLFKRFAKVEGLPITSPLEADLMEVAARMMKENTNCWVFKIEMLKRYLKIFLVYLIREFENDLQPVAQTRKTEHVDRFIDLLEQHFRTKKMVSDYADTLYVTPNYLNEIVKNTTGYPASYHIRQRIITEAKKMALCSDNNMKEIAYSLGFLDTAHFSKFFKTGAGGSFSDYKKQRLTIGVAV